MRRALLVATLFVFVAGGASLQAAHTVWSGLVVANNVPQPSPVPPELQQIEKTLKEVFGYNQFNIIGQSSKTLKTGEEDWLASSKYFALHVDSKGQTAEGYQVNLKLFKQPDTASPTPSPPSELLLETEAKLSKQSPLVIKGPQIGDGQLVLVLIVDDERTTPAHAHHRRQTNDLTTAWHRFTRLIRNALP